MKTIARYKEIVNSHPVVMNECFFAFSKEQFYEGLEKINVERDLVLSRDGGLYGTQKGLEEFFSFYEENHKRVALECDPQEVYDYEFNNHECEISQEDGPAIDIIVNYFGIDIAKTIKRKYAMN
jgi:hypothetical protein